CERMRPLFAACTSDAEHVKNVMRLLAVLRDSHTGVTDTSVDGKLLPSKWDGLYGGGLWIGWDQGLLVVMGLPHADGRPAARVRRRRDRRRAGVARDGARAAP